MILIAHRGNIAGPNPQLENKPEYLAGALSSGYDAEIDVWLIDGSSLFLGHDEPQYPILESFISTNAEFLWCHAKNVEALEFLLIKGYHCFWHQEDTYTITSERKIWTYPNKPLPTNAICVMPERGFVGDIWNCSGICSDYVGKITEKGIL